MPLPTPSVVGKRVLMLAYYYPPIRTSAVARTVGFAENLSALGWSPTVLTVDNPKDAWGVVGYDAVEPSTIPVVRTKEYNLTKLVDFADTCVNKARARLRLRGGKYYFRDLLAMPDPQIAWRAVGRGVELAKKHDYIYVSCSPFSSAWLATEVKRRTGRPLVVDFRDAWRLNPHQLQHTWLHKKITTRMERRVLERCDRLILNTEGARRAYRRAYPDFERKFVVIPNGYDLLNLASVGDAPADRFTILHAGSLYGNRDPRNLLHALADLNLPGAEFVQLGGGFSSYEEFKDKVPIKLNPSLPRQQALEMMKTASLLYLKQGWEPEVSQYIAVAAKTYEYLTTGLPILADCPPGDNVELVQRYSPHAYVESTGSCEALKPLLRQAYQNRHSVRPVINHDFVTRFSRQNLTRQLIKVFESLSQ